MSRRFPFRRWAAAAAVALLFGAGALYLQNRRAPLAEHIETASPAGVGATPLALPPHTIPNLGLPAAEEALQATPPPVSNGSPLAAELNAAGGSGQRDVEVLHTLLTRYIRRTRQKEGRPIGDDIDLAQALTGHNPLHLVLLPPNHPALGADGHLRDRWGTRYFIHPRGGSAFEIRSAGPDRKLFTDDDLICTATPSQAE